MESTAAIAGMRTGIKSSNNSPVCPSSSLRWQGQCSGIGGKAIA
ncbi:hypothetical protein [Oscillatoria sp. HE19RPO]|nr:hypothetical protein [Oscillatoria sp. HE19RPO]